MDNKVILKILFLCLFACPVYANTDNYVFDDRLIDNYQKAFDLNESGNYLEAYRQICAVDRSVNAVLAEQGGTAGALSDAEFEYPYWRITQSNAEIAYMLGVHTVMRTISEELHETVSQRSWDNTAEVRARKEALLANLAKIDGGIYYLTEKYDSAEMAWTKALRLNSYEHRFVCAVRDEMAQLYYKQGFYEKALAQLDTIMANPLYNGILRESEAEEKKKEIQMQRAICLARLGKYAEALDIIEPILIYYKNNGLEREYTESLRKKAKVLMLQYDSTDEYNPLAQYCYQEYFIRIKDFIDSHFVRMNESEREQYWMAEQPFVIDCFRLEDKDPELLYDVVLFSKAVLLQMGRDFDEKMGVEQLRKTLAAMRVSWRDVQKKMPASSCAIEFISYEKKGRGYMGAIVLGKEYDKPVFIEIAAVDEIVNKKLGCGAVVKDVFSATKDTVQINSLYNDEQLKNIVWNDKLIDAIGKSEFVYFAVDGIFHQLAIEYLVPQSLETKRFYRLTSTRLLVERHRKTNTSEMLMCGGVDYMITQDSVRTGNNDELAYSLMSSLQMNLPPLPGSLAEIDSIKSIRGGHVSDYVACADSATEATLRVLLQEYPNVLISTHGYFAEASSIGTDIRPAFADTQLSKSCLFLSGSEGNMKNNQFDSSQYDGILSAREIAQMDLSHVDVVVLSACMSGLGYITPDGVFGLQRGLKSAGVKSVIASLWEVDDEATALLMKYLYMNLEAGMSLYDAFSMARQSLKNTRITQCYYNFVRVKSFDKPSLFNAFILIDGLELY